jgi:putative ABC transport system substrate-binding protein
LIREARKHDVGCHGFSPFVFVQRLRELGWIEGHTVAIEYRWAEGRKERADELAAELVQLKVDLIMTYGTQCALAAKQATNSVPIVFALPGDPVATGLVASLARSGSNITGVSSQGTDLATKRLQILRETVPGLRRLAIMGNVDNPASVLDMAKVHAAARTLGLDAAIFEIRVPKILCPHLRRSRAAWTRFISLPMRS